MSENIREEIRKGLKEVEEVVLENPLVGMEMRNIPLSDSFGEYYIKAYRNLIVKLNKVRLKSSSEDDFPREMYKEIFESQLRMIRKAKRKVLNGEMYQHEKPFMLVGKKFSAAAVIANYFDGVIRFTKNDIYEYDNYPSLYSVNEVDVVGNYFESRYVNDYYVYKDTHIYRIGPHTNGLHYLKDTTEESKRGLLNIIAYYTGKPFYMMTDNSSFNHKLDNLYGEFDLYDLIALRHKDYLKKDIYSGARICKPVFKTKHHALIEFGEINHPQMLDSYHDSLKQFEPLPRCVFLYRVFEYAASVHYQPTFNPAEYNPRDAIEYYYNQAMQFDFSTLYAVRGIASRDREGGQPLFKSKHMNFANLLKKESVKVIDEWSNHNFLRTKSVGQIIYDTGRNRVAHGKRTNYRMTYDYQGNYMHINNVNIILELIARYVIETLNPSVYNLTERATKYYRGYI